MNDQTVTLDQLPNDPLLMPPLYWRGSGAIYHILDALIDLPHLLSELIPVHERTEARLDAYYQKHPDQPSDEDDV